MTLHTEVFTVRITTPTAPPIAIAADVLRTLTMYLRRHEGRKVRYEDAARGVVIEVEQQDEP